MPSAITYLNVTFLEDTQIGPLMVTTGMSFSLPEDIARGLGKHVTINGIGSASDALRADALGAGGGTSKPSQSIRSLSADRTLTAADDGLVYYATTSVVVTVPAGMNPMPLVGFLCPATGSVTIRPSGATVNGLTVDSVQNLNIAPSGFTLAPRYQSPNTYTLTSSLISFAGLAGSPNDNAALATALAAKYVLPPTGMPKSDMASAVKTSLGKADTALQPASVVDNLTTTLTAAPLSANQGVNIQAQIDALVTQFQQLTGGTITTTTDSLSTNEDVALTGNVLANDTTSTGTLTVAQFVIAGLQGINAAGATVAVTGIGSVRVNADGAFTFTPVANFNGAVPTITYQCTNGTDIANGNLTITVVPVNDAPIAQADSSSTIQGQAVTLNVLANDSDLDGDTLTITQINGIGVTVGNPLAITNATVTLNADKTLTYAPNSTVTGSQSFSYTVDDGHGGTAVANVSVNVVATGGSVTAPVILFTDCPTGPTTGGEGGLGGYLSVFGTNFGSQAGMGSTTKLYINGVEVANYRYLGPAKVYAYLGIQQLTVQVGNIGGLAVGTAGAIQMVINGTASSNNDHTYTPSGGRVLFWSLAGSDTTAAVNDFTKPWRHLQTVQQTGTAQTGQNSASTIDGLSKYMIAGDQAVGRGGNYTDSQGFDNSAFRFRTTSNQGSQKKWFHFTAYPGPIGGNAIEDVHYSTPSGTPPNATGGAAYRGGFQGANASYMGTTGDYVAISNLRFDIGAGASSDAAPINMQSSQFCWWATNNEIGPWPATVTTLSGGFSGHAQGDGVYRTQCMGNNIHDIACAGGLTNHGAYLDSGALHATIAYNRIANITGGNAVQWHDYAGLAGNNYTGYPPNWIGFQDIDVHHNFIDGYGKYGCNMSDNTLSGSFYDNIIINGTYAAFRVASTTSSTLDVDVYHNTVYNCDQVSSGSGNGQVLNSDNNASPGAIRYRNNLFVAGPQTLAASAVYSNNGGADSFNTFSENLWYGPTQGWTTFARDSLAKFTNPLLTNPAGGDFSPQSGSPAIDACTVTVPAIATDFFGTPRPQGAARDLGAIELVSTLPYVTVTPVLGGTARVGSSSTVTQGTWGNGPITQYAYQWKTSTTSSGALTPVSGATASSQAWTITDQGKYPAVTVSATNSVGTTSTTIRGGSPIAAHPNAPVNTTPSSITGTGGIGNVLTRVAGVWTPNSGADQATIAWIWNRNGTAISGTAGAATYTQVTADDAAVITITETGSNQWGSNTANSSNSITVPHIPAAPVLVGSAVGFDSSVATVIVTRTVQTGDYLALHFSTNNNAPGNLTITDDQGGANSDWVSYADGLSNNTHGGWRIKKITATGTINVTVGKDGTATYAGQSFVVRGVATSPFDGAAVAAAGTASPATATPSTTTNSKDLILEGVAASNSAWATGWTYNSTFVASKDAASEGRQVQIQSRTTSSAGAQSAMSMTFSTGSSGLDAHTVSSIVNFKGA